jgi:HEAT repeat protein
MKYSKNEKLNAALIKLAEAKSRDESDARLNELYPIAIENLRDFASAYFDGSYNRFPLVWIMQGVQDDLAFEILKDAIKDRDQYIRWAAAEGLAKSHKKERIELLIMCLKDRSHLVKGVAVGAMKGIKDKRAIPLLKHIVSLKSMQENAPGIVRDALQVLEIIEG